MLIRETRPAVCGATGTAVAAAVHFFLADGRRRRKGTFASVLAAVLYSRITLPALSPMPPLLNRGLML